MQPPVNLPDGTYKDSCSGCALSEGRLSCESCQDGKGKAHATSMATFGCHKYGNENGKLVCIAGPAAGDELKSEL